jgi:molybdopterin molybdotransferase
MISVNEAMERINRTAKRLAPVTLPLLDAANLVLADDVFAPINIPSFDQSAMDGYAFRFADLLQSAEFTVNHEAPAGGSLHYEHKPHQAVRIFTGAAIPSGLDTVVMQEKTAAQPGHVVVMDEALAPGRNVRPTGSEIKKGELAIKKETVLAPAAIGFLANLGFTQVKVYPLPIVHIIVTGKELEKPGNPLLHGQLYESNGAMLQAALKQFHITTPTLTTADDSVEVIASAIRTALETADLVLLTGGVSVGNYDFVVQAAEECGVEKLFHKVAQRPGKPLFCGTKSNKIVFGLPGNPASVLSCFYVYVVAAIEELCGKKEMLKRTQLPLLAEFDKTVALRQFLKGQYTPDGVMPLGAQESFRLSSFAVANCLIDLPEESKEYKKGDTVEVLLIA